MHLVPPVKRKGPFIWAMHEQKGVDAYKWRNMISYRTKPHMCVYTQVSSFIYKKGSLGCMSLGGFLTAHDTQRRGQQYHLSLPNFTFCIPLLKHVTHPTPDSAHFQYLRWGYKPCSKQQSTLPACSLHPIHPDLYVNKETGECYLQSSKCEKEVTPCTRGLSPLFCFPLLCALVPLLEEGGPSTFSDL